MRIELRGVIRRVLLPLPCLEELRVTNGNLLILLRLLWRLAADVVLLLRVLRYRGLDIRLPR